MATDMDGTLTRNDLKGFPREIQTVLLSLANTHGVRWRMPDGMHILLYSGQNGTRPFKISAQRQPQATTRYLIKWISDNVPNYFVDTPAPQPSTEAEDEMSTPTPAPPVQESRPLIFKDNRVSDFMMRKPDGSVWCTECSYVSDTARGAHLHEAVHKPEAQAAIIANSVEAKQQRKAAREQEAQQQTLALHNAIAVMAGYIGCQLVSIDDLVQNEDYEAMVAERDALRVLNEELKTKLQLIREAMSV